MDRHRPQYHFLPPANWMNDPNGLVQWQGTYHLFYQHNPDAAYWGNMHWGHASSLDLVHWQHHPIALAPTPGGPDEAGVWSGCFVNNDGLPTMVYTGWLGTEENVCLATSRDGLLTWEKYAGNPVIAGPPAGLKTTGFRDPYVWRENDVWWMVMGSGIRGAGGLVLLYSSSDLVHWTEIGTLIAGDVAQKEPVWTAKMWECPNFFPLGDRHVLMISAMDLDPSRSLYTLYFTGAFRDNRFVPDTLAKMDGGDIYFYAPQAFLDEQRRRITIGWAREARTVDASVEAGWAGVMTLPRLLELQPGGQLRQRPVPEVESLRGASRSWENFVLPGDGEPQALDGLSGDTLELEVTFTLDAPQDGEEGELGLYIRQSPDREEVTEIRVDRKAEILVVDTLRSSLSRDVQPEVHEIPLPLADQERLHLRIFLDRSIVEVFANDTAVITARLYPAREDSTGIAFFARRHPGKVEQVRAWAMNRAEEPSS